ncbi:MAG: glycosyltransferase family 39 protein [Solirubrobacteraceae bacterium]
MLLPARTGALTGARPGRRPWPLTAPIATRIVIGLTVLSVIVRFALIDSQSYWLDEAQAAHELSLSFGAMLGAWSRAEWNPPLYFLIAWPWAKVFGTGELGLRSLSALLGAGLVPLLYLSGRELVSSRAGVVAAALASVNPFMIWYSQEAREYMLLVVLCAASLLFFARAWRSPSSRELAWWAIFSALAMVTQYFAGFLILAEGLLLLYRARSRAALIACAVQVVVVAPLIPHVIPQLRSPAEFITSQPLSQRLAQVPVTFALNTLYKGPAVSYGLLGAAALAAAVIALLVIGGDDRELRGAGIAAVLAGSVLLIPLVVALAGHDDYIARGLMPAWPPLAIVIGAACTTRGAKLPGAALVAVLMGSFAWAAIKIDTDSSYQRPDWRGVATALGSTGATRAVVAYDGQFATGPLSIYLPRVAWSGPGESAGANAGPVTVRELDVVGETSQTLGRLPPGTRLIGSRAVDGYQVDRFSLARPWATSAPAILHRATSLLTPVPAGASVIIQRGSA